MGFQDDLERLGGPQGGSQPATDDWQRDLDRLGSNTVGGQAPQQPQQAKPPTPPTTPSTTAAAAPPPDTEWSALPSHILPSAAAFAGNIGHAIMHPIQSAQSVADIGMGALELAGISAGDEHKPMARAFGQMMADRYGGLDKLKQTVINDPVGFAADASALFGGAGLAARGAGMAGTADMAAQAARLTNPMTAVGVPARMLGKGAAQVIGGLTHTGPGPLESAAEAGAAGGTKAAAFKEQLTRRAPMEAPVEDVHDAISRLVSDQKGRYAQDMQRLGLDRRQLSLGDTFQAVQNAQYMGGFGTTMSKNPVTQETWKAINDTVQEWALKGAQDPSYMTAIGLDGLKRQIGKLGPHSGESGAMIADVQKALRGTIAKNAPEYTGYMKSFEQAEDIIRELRKTFSVPPGRQRGAAIDTQLRKLQSLMRDNVNTSYGYRAKLAEYLTDEAPDLMAKLAGQALSPWMARGLGSLAFNLGVEGAGALLGAGGLTGGALGAAAVFPFMSPRLMGNAAFNLGRASRLGAYAPAAFQFGRADETVNP